MELEPMTPEQAANFLGNIHVLHSADVQGLIGNYVALTKVLEAAQQPEP